MNMHGRSFGGDKLSSGTGATFQAISPLDRSSLQPSFFLAGEDDVNSALYLAETAFETFREISGEQRAVLLERIADELSARFFSCWWRYRVSAGDGQRSGC